MSVKITISVDEQVKRSLSALARKKRKTISGFISEMVKRESVLENIPARKQGLGSLLRTHHSGLKGDKGEDYKEMLGRMLEEKHLS